MKCIGIAGMLLWCCIYIGVGCDMDGRAPTTPSAQSSIIGGSSSEPEEEKGKDGEENTIVFNAKDRNSNIPMNLVNPINQERKKNTDDGTDESGEELLPDEIRDGGGDTGGPSDGGSRRDDDTAGDGELIPDEVIDTDDATDTDPTPPEDIQPIARGGGGGGDDDPPLVDEVIE